MVAGFGVDASQNYKTWGNVEPITLTSRATEADDAFTIPVAKRRAPTDDEVAASNGVYVKEDLVWLLPATLVTAAGATGTKAPKPGDLVTDADGTEWTILSRAYNTLKSTFRCMTRDLILAYDLRGLLTIQRPQATTTDAAAGRTFAYDTAYEDIPCRIQETSSEPGEERGKRVTVKRYTVTVNQRLRLTIEDRIVDQDDGEIYEITGWDNADRIDQLMTIEAKKAWGTI